MKNCTMFSDDFYYARREYCIDVYHKTGVNAVGSFDGMPMYFDRKD